MIIRAQGRETGISNLAPANAGMLDKLSPLPLLELSVVTELFIVNTPALPSPDSLFLFSGTTHQPPKIQMESILLAWITTISFTFGALNISEEDEMKISTLKRCS